MIKEYTLKNESRKNFVYCTLKTKGKKVREFDAGIGHVPKTIYELNDSALIFDQQEDIITMVGREKNLEQIIKSLKKDYEIELNELKN